MQLQNNVLNQPEARRLDAGWPNWKRKTLKRSIIAALVVLSGLAWSFSEIPRAFAYSAFRGLNKYGIGLQTRGWNRVEGAHFQVRYLSEDADVAEIVLETAEKAVAPVNSRLGYAPGGRMLVLVYPTRDSLGESFGWSSDQSAMGVYWAGVIRVLSPTAWIERAPAAQVAEEFQSAGPMVHEYTHLVVDYITRGNYPRWLTEGVAQYIEREITGFTLSEQLIHPHEEWFALSELDSNFDNPLSQAKAYRQSLAAIEYLSQEYGQDTFVKILYRLGKGLDLNSAWEAETGISLEQFQQDFNYWTRQQEVAYDKTGYFPGEIK